MNKNLHKAKKEKNDEFYTQLIDIENELKHYKDHFRGKTVLCNCDLPHSNFVKYFQNNFQELGLKKLLHSGYNKETGDGDFRSQECIELLKQADIVVTNPPFSLFREYVSQLVEYDKKFIIIGNQNAITYKEIFKLIKEHKLWLGYNYLRFFNKLDGNLFETARSFWFTNLDHNKRHEDLILYKKYNKEEFPHYDNYDAINVDQVKDIPLDWKGAMGVPITFLDKYNPEQFEILGLSASAGYSEEIVGLPFLGDKDARPLINGKNTYARVFIKNKKI